MGIGPFYIMQIVEGGDSYTRKCVYEYKQVIRGEPDDAKDIAPKM